MKGAWRWILGIAVSVLLIWWVLRDVEIAEVAQQIATGNPWWFFGSVFVGTSGYFIRAMRWKIFLHPLKPDTALHSRWAGISIGFMVTNLIPGRVGELARPYALGRLERLSFSGALGTLVVERFLDTVVMLSFLFIAVLSPGFPDSVALFSGDLGLLVRGAFVFMAILIVLLLAMLFFPEPVVRVTGRMATRLPGRWRGRVVEALDSFLQAMRLFRSPVLLFKAVAWSYGFWLWHGLSFWMGFKAFGVDVGFSAAIFTEAVVAFAVAVPAAPGFFGTFQAGAALALIDVYGMPGPQTLAFAFGYHFGGFVPITLFGLYYAWRLGFSLNDINGKGGSSADAL
ncbi:MAG: lysylphosphatidylglycerol synthase transmembrane domain-containing protein [Gemmatimonadota bacterium]|nr:MAG: lysylphosphatidylglycerol synthase transmembrane domain-containing protein [Gemmatimonadota bacterium]